MAKEFAKKFYKSKAWKKCREAYISQRRLIDGGLCEVCHEEPGYILHHKEVLTAQNINDPLVTLNPALLRYECKSCHDREEEHWLDGKQKGYKSLVCCFDEAGQPIDERKI